MTTSLKDLNIVLGVTGGIAAYKAADLASKLTKAGACVHTIMTRSACKLVTPRTFQAVTGQTVFTKMWDTPADFNIGHINLAQKADIVVIAPATANIIAKTANGICDDLLSTTLCAAWSKPILFAPAMNNNMWTNPAVQKNIQTIKNMGVKTIGPDTGHLACGTDAIGRMAEPAGILEAIEKIAATLSA